MPGGAAPDALAKRAASWKDPSGSDLPHHQRAAGAGQCAGTAAEGAGHWRIENKAHWIRDVDWDEDLCQVRTGAAPQFLAAYRNLAHSLLRRRHCSNIAAALRTNAGRPGSAVQLVLTGGVN